MLLGLEINVVGAVDCLSDAVDIVGYGKASTDLGAVLDIVDTIGNLSGRSSAREIDRGISCEEKFDLQ